MNISLVRNGSGDHSHWKSVENVAFQIQTYYLWLILVLGFPGNCATIIIVIKMCPVRSLLVYIASLAVVDNLAILVKLLLFVLLDTKTHIGDFGCKVLGYFGNFLITFANWLLVAMSAERFVAVWFPFKLGRKWTFKKSACAVCLIGVPLAILFLPLLWMLRFSETSGNYFCEIHEEYLYFMMHVWFWINVAVYALIPCTVILLFNILIIYGIKRSDRVQKSLQCCPLDQSNVSVDRHRPITMMLVTAAVTLVILTMPRCIMLLLTPYWDPFMDSLEGATKYLMDTLAFLLCDLTHAVNFYVYSLSGKVFRNQLKTLCSCKAEAENENTKPVTLLCRSSLNPNSCNVKPRSPQPFR